MMAESRFGDEVEERQWLKGFLARLFSLIERGIKLPDSTTVKQMKEVFECSMKKEITT